MSNQTVSDHTKQTAIRCTHCNSENIDLHDYRLVVGDCIRVDASCADCGKELYADFLFDCMANPDED